MGLGANNQIYFLLTGRWAYEWGWGGRGGGRRSGGIIIRSLQYYIIISFITQRNVSD